MNNIVKISFVFLLFACSPETIEKDQLQIRNGLFYKVNSNEVFTGQVTSSHSNNQIKEYIEIKNGFYDGEYATYKNNGLLESKGALTNGSGKVFFYDSNGKEKKIQYYFKNKREAYEVIVVEDLKLFELDASNIFKELMLKSKSIETKVYDPEALENILLQEIIEELGVTDAILDVAFNQYVANLLMKEESEYSPYSYGYLSEDINFQNQIPSAVLTYFLAKSFWQEFCQNAKYRCQRSWGKALDEEIKINLENEGIDGIAFTLNDNLITTEYFADKGWYTNQYSLTRESVKESRMISSMPNIFYVQDKIDGQYQTIRILNINDDEALISDSESNFEDKTLEIYHEKILVNIDSEYAKCWIYDGGYYYLSNSEYGDFNKLKESVNSIPDLTALISEQNNESSLCLKLFEHDDVKKRLEDFYLKKRQEQKRQQEKQEFLKLMEPYIKILRKFNSEDGLPENLESIYSPYWSEGRSNMLSERAAREVTKILEVLDSDPSDSDLNALLVYIDELAVSSFTEYDLGMIDYHTGNINFLLGRAKETAISYEAAVNNLSLAPFFRGRLRCELTDMFAKEETKPKYFENLFHCVAFQAGLIAHSSNEASPFLDKKVHYEDFFIRLEQLAATYFMLGFNEYSTNVIINIKKQAEILNLEMSDLSSSLYSLLVRKEAIDLEINFEKIKELLSKSNMTPNYIPLFKVQPVYPRRAYERGIEGYVIVAFTITESGTIEDPYVIEGKCRSQNNRAGDYEDCSMFNSATIRAALKLKYRPTVRDGKIVAVEDVPHKYTFELEY